MLWEGESTNEKEGEEEQEKEEEDEGEEDEEEKPRACLSSLASSMLVLQRIPAKDELDERKLRLLLRRLHDQT